MWNHVSPKSDGKRRVQGRTRVAEGGIHYTHVSLGVRHVESVGDLEAIHLLSLRAQSDFTVGGIKEVSAKPMLCRQARNL